MKSYVSIEIDKKQDRITNTNKLAYSLISGAPNNIFTYKGVEELLSSLPSSENSVGDVWHVNADSGEYYWNGSAWEFAGSDYYTNLNNKQDKIDEEHKLNAEYVSGFNKVIKEGNGISITGDDILIITLTGDAGSGGTTYTSNNPLSVDYISGFEEANKHFVTSEEKSSWVTSGNLSSNLSSYLSSNISLYWKYLSGSMNTTITENYYTSAQVDESYAKKIDISNKLDATYIKNISNLIKSGSDNISITNSEDDTISIAYTGSLDGSTTVSPYSATNKLNVDWISGMYSEGGNIDKNFVSSSQINTWNNKLGLSGTSLVIGSYTTAIGSYSLVEGLSSITSGSYSHAEGLGTITSGDYQHVEGRYNIPLSEYQHIVGGGSDNSNKLNIQTLDWNGNEYLSGNISGADFITNDGNHKLSLKADTNAPLSGFAEDDEHRLVSSSQIAEWNGKTTLTDVSNSLLTAYYTSGQVEDKLTGYAKSFNESNKLSAGYISGWDLVEISGLKNYNTLSPEEYPILKFKVTDTSTLTINPGYIYNITIADGVSGHLYFNCNNGIKSTDIKVYININNSGIIDSPEENIPADAKIIKNVSGCLEEFDQNMKNICLIDYDGNTPYMIYCGSREN